MPNPKSAITFLEKILPKGLSEAELIAARKSMTPAQTEEYMKALNEVYGPAAKRAEDMGFSPETYYHGTADDIEQFNSKFFGSHTGEGTTKDKFWFSDNPEVAKEFAASASKLKQHAAGNKVLDSIYRKQADLFSEIKNEGISPFIKDLSKLVNGPISHAETFAKTGDISKNQLEKIKQIKQLDDVEGYVSANKLRRARESEGQIYPVKLKASNLPEKDFKGKFWSEVGNEFPEGEFRAKNIRESTPYDEYEMGTSVGLVDPKKIRSTNAAFDPRYSNSKYILAGGAAMNTPKIDNPAELVQKGFNWYNENIADKLKDKFIDKQAEAFHQDKEQMKKEPIYNTLSGIITDPTSYIGYAEGGTIPGEAKVEGNSPKNDTVKINVSPGEIVVDRETISKGPEAILHFIMGEMHKQPHVFKKNFNDGGMTVNPKQAELAEYFGARPAQAPSAGPDIYKSPNYRLQELEKLKVNLGKIPTQFQSEYNRLRAIQDYQLQQQPMQQQVIPAQPGYAEGGTVEAFDPDKYLAEKTASSSFDPDKYLEQKVGKKESSFGDKAQTALENYGQAMTLGYLPQIQAATEPITAKIYNAVTGENVEADPYLKARDENIKRINEESERNPKSALAGNVAGFIGSAAVAPELPILKGAGAIKNIARGSIMGAGYGAAQNPGDVPGEVTPLQTEERLHNAKTGAAIGAAVGGAGALINKGAKLLKGSAEAARETANTQAVRAAGAMLKDMRVLNANDKIDDIGKFALDNGIVKAGDTVRDVADKADIVREKAGKKLDEIYQMAQKSLETNPEAAKIKGFSPFHAKEEILSSVEEKLGDSVDKKESIGAVRKYLNQLIEDYGDKELTPKIANNIKTNLDKKINYARNPMTKNPAAEEGFSIMRDYVNNSVKNHIDQIGKVLEHEDLAKELALANKEYGYAKQLQNMAEDRSAREIANRSFGLTDTIAGVGGAAAGALMGAASGHGVEGGALGLLAGGVNKLARTAGPGALAQAAHKAEPILEKTAVPLGKMLEKVPSEVLQKAAIMDASSLAKGGPKKWSNDGYSVLYSHVDKEDKEYLKSMKDKLISDPKSQRLLIEASALKRGSKKLDKVIADLKELKK